MLGNIKNYFHDPPTVSLNPLLVQILTIYIKVTCILESKVKVFIYSYTKFLSGVRHLWDFKWMCWCETFFVYLLSSFVLVFKRIIAVHGVLFCAAIWRNQRWWLPGRYSNSISIFTVSEPSLVTCIPLPVVRTARDMLRRSAPDVITTSSIINKHRRSRDHTRGHVTKRSPDLPVARDQWSPQTAEIK